MFLPLLPIPVQYVEDNLGVMSVGFLLSSPDDAVIWRGPKKNGLSLPPWVCLHPGWGWGVLWAPNVFVLC